ncbi:hypothetical protein Micbo1qcDRAFT_20682 [Microdochium bolleyi]|uniref:Uncharacterized protein n=1 Tax=Microdochium bolleyi TaxID=196109 RepID=A0A136IRQ8_9PEZI|nr:hypothetical protein Micbo1qcDRAFT_20682 [Microdochium bolleyi]
MGRDDRTLLGSFVEIYSYAIAAGCRKALVVTRWGLFLVRGGSSTLHFLLLSGENRGSCVCLLTQVRICDGFLDTSSTPSVMVRRMGKKHFTLSPYWLSRKLGHQSFLSTRASLAYGGRHCQGVEAYPHKVCQAFQPLSFRHVGLGTRTHVQVMTHTIESSTEAAHRGYSY